MMAWVAATGGVRAVGAAGGVTVETEGWADCAGPSVCRTVDACVDGAVSSMSVSVRSATLVDGSGTRTTVTGEGELGDGEYRLDCRVRADRQTPGEVDGETEASVELVVRFGGPAIVAREGDRLELRFPSPTPVTLGFTERRADPPTITVPSTPAGIAEGLSHLSSALRTTAPARSHPSLRSRPPVLEVGEELSVPAAVEEATPDTGIELQLPDSLPYLFVGAPLAYYLGADVTVGDAAAPRLHAPAADVEYRFRELPTFQHGVGRLLRQVFFFDTLVRDLEGECSAQKRRLRERFGLDPERVRSMSPAERLGRYFWVSEPDLGSHLPDWHFSTYAAPTTENVRCLPYLLDALSLVYLPEASDLGENDLLERTLDDFYRSSNAANRPVQSVDVVDPELQAGRVHAWLASEAPIDAFKTTPRAYENRAQYRPRRHRTDSLDVTVVLNDAAMSDEQTDVADIYRERSADLPLSVTVHERLTTDELAAVFATPTDFVHYIGHCERDGLSCADGALDVADIDRCRARTFFLNACGSYHQGLELVERGSVAGAVTLTKVLDQQAATVGTAFARLLVHGYGFEPAMQLSRRRIMMGKDYAVVGDGTYTLAPATRTPIVGFLERSGDGYELSCEAVSAHQAGDTYQPPFAEESYLQGTTAECTLGPAALAAVLRDRPFPVVFDGEFHWSTELATRFE